MRTYYGTLCQEKGGLCGKDDGEIVIWGTLFLNELKLQDVGVTL
jgi:hypothetical protein